MTLLPVKSSRTLILSLSAAFVLASCSESSTGPGGGEAAQKPTIGSTFTNAYVQIDPDGNPVANTEDTATATADEYLTDFEGKSDVVKFTSKTGPLYLSYEENGDVSLQFLVTLQGTSENVWLRLPVASGEDVDEEVFNDTKTQGGVTSTAAATFNATNDGSKEVTISGKTMTAQKISGKITATFSFGAGGQQTTMTTDYVLNIEFIPEIGMLNLYEISIAFQGQAPGSTVHTNLIDFAIK